MALKFVFHKLFITASNFF